MAVQRGVGEWIRTDMSWAKNFRFDGERKHIDYKTRVSTRRNEALHPIQSNPAVQARRLLKESRLIISVRLCCMHPPFQEETTTSRININNHTIILLLRLALVPAISACASATTGTTTFVLTSAPNLPSGANLDVEVFWLPLPSAV